MIVGRRTGRPHTRAGRPDYTGGTYYVGHPNGPAQSTRNLASGGVLQLRLPGHLPVAARACKLAASDPDRYAAIDAAGRRQPWPASWLYIAARTHIEAVGEYFRPEVVSEPR